jgi:2-keto-4-pentenoate hydratase
MTALADALLTTWDKGGQTAPLCNREDFGLAPAYCLAALLAERRVARGERIAGRKIGFTNRTIWPIYGVSAPIWGWMYNSTMKNLPADGRVPLPRQPEPRLEPEIAFGFHTSPTPEMNIAQLAACLDWVAHGFEIVVSIFPGWKVSAADAVAGFGMHGAFWLGPKVPAAPLIGNEPGTLECFTLTLEGPGERHVGQATDVLGGPLRALARLVEEIARMPGAGPILPGEVVTTGTLTDARPVRSGEKWRTSFEGIGLDGLEIEFL